VKERPILFSGEMVRAILDGRKTQTRRVIKPQPFECMRRHPSDGGAPCGLLVWGDDYHVSDSVLETMSPYGVPGDRLWVRESFKEWSDGQVFYAATPTVAKGMSLIPLGNWKPSIHMPRRLSRITLEIVSVRVERVQDISLDDVIAEGFPIDRDSLAAETPEWYKAAFSGLWDKINAKINDRSWKNNPWVWVIGFRRIM